LQALNLTMVDAAPTLDNATVRLDGTLSANAGATIVLGPHLSLQPNANLGGAGVIDNLGTITGLGFSVSAGFINAGTVDITSNARSTSVLGQMTNSGVLIVENANAFVVLGDLNNTGTINGIHDPNVPSASIMAGGLLQFHGNLTGTGKLLANNTNVTVGGTIGAGEDIIRQTGSMWIMAGAIDPGATIEGFAVGSTIDLTSLAQDGNINASFSGTSAGGTLTVMDGTTVKASIFLEGIANGSTFTIASPTGSSDTAITTNSPACFLAGTRMQTARGKIPVESLRVGDLLPALRSGKSLPVQWLGYRTLRCDHHPRPRNVWPVRVAANAFAKGVPCRDLWLSP
jgi:hypothetical protein